MGHKTGVHAGQIRAYIERAERLREDKRAISDDEKAVFAEAKSAGFHTGVLRSLIRRRSKKPHELAEFEAIEETYMHALGMLAEPPLFRHVGMMAADVSKRDEVIEALKAFVPENGSIVVEAGGVPVRLTRAKDGTVSVADVESPAPAFASRPAAPAAPRAARPAAPECSPDEAEAMGADAYRANAAIIANPFPFGNALRARWDSGWRRASGGDGMGPDD